MKIVFLGLSITSSWGNGHATTYRALVRELAARGHEVTFFERDMPWYANNRDLPNPPFGRTELYSSLDQLTSRFHRIVSRADVVVVGSYVPEGVKVGDWVLCTASSVTAFYDIDTPVTCAKLKRGDYEYIHPDQIPLYDVYLSFTGGPTLQRIERDWGARRARALYCSFDPGLYYPDEFKKQWTAGYLGTYSADRQTMLDGLLCETARRSPKDRFVIAGPLYPENLKWPSNVDRISHLAPDRHREFYCSQRTTLNVTRADMVRAGYSPSVRLFEAAACGCPIISDDWPGIEEFFTPGREILIARSADDVMRHIGNPDSELMRVAQKARQRVMHRHTAAHRAVEFEQILSSLLQRRHSPPVHSAPGI